MDVAYDHIQEESFPDDDTRDKKETNETKERRKSEINQDFQDAYKAISSSPWATRLGGLWGTVRKQGEQYYAGAQTQYSNASEQATKGISSIIGRTRGLSINTGGASASTEEKSKEKDVSAHPDRPESLPADIVKEAEGILSRLKVEAAKRLKEVEKAEDAADEALLKFGTNIRNYLRDAVTITAPEDSDGKEGSTVLFESKDAEGKRVIHTTRFDAQLHVIHTTLDNFTKDPQSSEYGPWAKKFDAQAYTDAISKDLEKYEELRKSMEKIVPEQVEYAQFWKRYYFLRHVIGTEEQKRREMLKKASAAVPEDESIAWDEDSEEEEESSEEESEEESDDESPTPITNALNASKETLKPASKQNLLKPEEPRKSNDQNSQAGSDASYDIVSGASSRAPGSPRDAKKDVVEEESDEEDWE